MFTLQTIFVSVDVHVRVKRCVLSLDIYDDAVDGVNWSVLDSRVKMLAVRNWLMPERKAPDTPKMRMPEQLLRSFRRRSLRVKRTKSLVLQEKRKSGKFKLKS